MKADDIQATLEYLVPGFVALKVFYVLGLRTRRSDFGWTVLSIATAAFLNFAATNYWGITDPDYRVIDATVLGIGVALVAGLMWRFVAPTWGHLFDRQAWDAAFVRPHWVAVWVKDGPIVLGWPKTVSESAEADDQDVYLVEPTFLDRGTNAETQIPTIRGIWISASEIQLIQVYRGPKDPPPLEV